MRKKMSVAGVVGVAALTCGMFAARSWGQPVEGAVGKAQNPANQPVNPPVAKTPNERLQDALRKRGQEGLVQAGIVLATMTPEQRAQAVREAEAKALRVTLANAGFNDLELVEVLEKFLAQRMQSRRALRVTSTLLYLASGADGQRSIKASDAQVAALIQRLEDETQAQKKSEVKALDELDAQIEWKTQPRLQAVLIHNGVIGESSWYARSNLFGQTQSTDIDIIRFWNANHRLPPGIELPVTPDVAPTR